MTEMQAEMHKSRSELNGMVISAELTLISIIQGVALYFLVNASYQAVVDLQIQYWPYLIAGLMIICLVWSRALIHIFTMIRWPLEFGHNFLYIVLSLVEAVLFTQVLNPLKWFVASIGFWIFAWITFVFDMRMIRKLANETGSVSFHQLMLLTQKEQLLNIRVILPLGLLANVLFSFTLCYGPDFWLKEGHILFAALQVLGLLGYQLYSLRFYKRLTKLL